MYVIIIIFEHIFQPQFMNRGNYTVSHHREGYMISSFPSMI